MSVEANKCPLTSAEPGAVPSANEPTAESNVECHSADEEGEGKARTRSKSALSNSADLEAAEMMAAAAAESHAQSVSGTQSISRAQSISGAQSVFGAQSISAESRPRADTISIIQSTQGIRRNASLSTRSTRSFGWHPHSRESSAAAAALERGEHSTGSSLYGGSSLGNTASVAHGNASVMNGTLSPPYTLVNSDGASMRVHTGSIRERHMQHRISAIHEDDSDVYSDSLLFTYEVPSASSRYYYQGSGAQHGRQYGADGMGVADSDGMSMMSGLSDGGASTTRVRMATDRAYNALRIGPQAASLLSYYSGHNNGMHRVTSFAASSDPGGLASAASYYDMYFMDQDRYGPLRNSRGDSVSENNDVANVDNDNNSDEDDDEANNTTGDIVSVIRSDVAVYGGAHEDVKFPFLTDNMSEFSGPFICSSTGALDIDRISRDYSEIMYYQPHSPQFFDHAPFDPRSENVQSPPASLLQRREHEQSQEHHMQGHARENEQEDHAGKKIKKKKKKDARLTSRYPRDKRRAGTTPANYAAGSTSPADFVARSTSPSLGVRQPMPPATVGSAMAHPWRHAARRYRHQSAGESTYQSAAVAAMVAATNTAAAQPAVSRPSESGHTTPAIRPNAIMRFLKRIAPRN
ncbi:hypothetical protein IWW50_002179 [Coemansia erecta]|nr:hypothetical protein IWW50_002179 [Coemansia erecta]